MNRETTLIPAADLMARICKRIHRLLITRAFGSGLSPSAGLFKIWTDEEGEHHRWQRLRAGDYNPDSELFCLVVMTNT